ncbi:MAG TPA: type II toxin-antitoxin system Phd/YefM family antitoxin [Gammaproteobacteria bacterium]|nr:type II toxin-antitoxin system Phd/YefM family antitoxin [Gammaproteobacteria bacterium]
MSDVQEIQSYEARVRWGSVLDQVSAGRTYVISKRHRAVAALVPLEQWHGRDDSDDARELDALLRELHARHADTVAALDDAFAELTRMRKELAALRTDRANGRSEEAGRARRA